MLLETEEPGADRGPHELPMCSTFPPMSTIPPARPAPGRPPAADREGRGVGGEGRFDLHWSPMGDDWQDSERLRHVFEQTEIVRKPLTGIVTGYHVLPYVLVAPEHEHAGRSVEVSGSIRVSPRLVLG